MAIMEALNAVPVHKPLSGYTLIHEKPVCACVHFNSGTLKSLGLDVCAFLECLIYSIHPCPRCSGPFLSAHKQQGRTFWEIPFIVFNTESRFRPTPLESVHNSVLKQSVRVVLRIYLGGCIIMCVCVCVCV